LIACVLWLVQEALNAQQVDHTHNTTQGEVLCIVLIVKEFDEGLGISNPSSFYKQVSQFQLVLSMAQLLQQTGKISIWRAAQAS